MEPVMLSTLIEGKLEPSLCDIQVGHLAKDSRHVEKNTLFFVIPGKQFDPRSFLDQAFEKGAVALVTQEPLGSPYPEVVVPDIHRAALYAIEKLYGNPSDRMNLIGVTGTSGKTTTTWLTFQLLEKLHQKTGLLGTICNKWPGHEEKATRTTDDLFANHSYLHQMQDAGCTHSVLEVTSHALDQKRLELVDFDVAVFLNLSHEHLDYHLSYEKYLQAKLKIFSKMKKTAVAILNRDDPVFDQVAQGISHPMTFSSESNREATFWIDQIEMAITGSRCQLHFQNKIYPIETRLLGKFNLSNLLASIATMIALGFDVEEVVGHLPQLEPPLGRLQPFFYEDRGVFIDYAHKPDALKNALETLRPLCKGRLIALFGCGGDRDQDKRSRMGKIASHCADYVIITSDNPRTEEPLSICKQIEEGLGPCEYHITVDRKEAIYQGLSMLKKEDVLLVAGRGHEQVQAIGNREVPMSDIDLVTEFYFSRSL